MEFRIINKIKVFAPKSREELINEALEQKKILIAINAEKILKADQEIVDLVNQNIGYPDGVGAVWALRDKGCKDAIKIPGVELWLNIVAKNFEKKSFYLIGGSESVIKNTVSKLNHEFPGINILNYRDGFLKNENELLSLKQDISVKKPDIIFVAMGSPRQEKLMKDLYMIHDALYQGLGGSFDVYTNNVKRAPEFWIKNNLEWAYRLFKQPKRILRQSTLLIFLLKLKLKQL